MTSDNRSGPKGRLVSEHVPDALDLLELEEQERRLDAEYEAIEKQTFLVPGAKKRALAKIEAERGAVRQRIAVAQEHVRSNLTSTQIYEARKHQPVPFDEAAWLEQRKLRMKRKPKL